MEEAAPKKRPGEWWVVETHTDNPDFNYRRLWLGLVSLTSVVALVPLVVMMVINLQQYRSAFHEEVEQPVMLVTSNARRSLEFYVNERISVLEFIVHDVPYDELVERGRLAGVFRNLKVNQPDIVDIGLIDEKGTQLHYVGPYDLQGKAYNSQEWFGEALIEGRAVSAVFTGHRKSPHFAIAVRGINEDGRPFLLRETLNAEVLVSILEGDSAQEQLDTFIVNWDGVLQTPSLRYGELMSRTDLVLPPPSDGAHVVEQRNAEGRTVVVGFAYIPDTPFVYVAVVERDTALHEWWVLRNRLFMFLVGSMIIIVIVVYVGMSLLVSRIRDADTKRMAVLHNVEYTAKMASIGRLAAGVAHEINNPLAIINEKAGLMKDLLEYSEDFPQREKFLRTVDPILASVDRCGRITRRLLRFAKHIDVQRERIQLEALLREVLAFLDKEATYRNLDVKLEVQDGVPVIESDRGRLQQVFLNIINNAFAAVEDGGRIRLYVAREGDRHVSVTIRDNGVGIPEEQRRQIFEPFFTTKGQDGTGLGLSITYGLVEKLGGRITVDSQVGQWTKFTVTLPVTPDTPGAGDGADSSPAGR